MRFSKPFGPIFHKITAMLTIALIATLFGCAENSEPQLGDTNQHLEESYQDWLVPVAEQYFKNMNDETVGGQMGLPPSLTEDGALVTCVKSSQLLPQVFSLVLGKTSEVVFDGDVDWVDPETGEVSRVRSARVCGQVFYQVDYVPGTNLPRECPYRMCCTFTRTPRRFPYVTVRCERRRVDSPGGLACNPLF